MIKFYEEQNWILPVALLNIRGVRWPGERSNIVTLFRSLLMCDVVGNLQEYVESENGDDTIIKYKYNSNDCVFSCKKCIETLSNITDNFTLIKNPDLCPDS